MWGASGGLVWGEGFASVRFEIHYLMEVRSYKPDANRH